MNKPIIVGKNIILTHSGIYFDFVDPKPDMIRIEDIAHALAHTCRFGGHCSKFYSVAQHSVITASLVPEELRLTALLHDAPEAYLGDVVKPLKKMLPDYNQIEERIQKLVLTTLGAVYPLPEEVHAADLGMLKWEQRDIMKNQDDWPSVRDVVMPYYGKHSLTPWSVEVSKGMFLETYSCLSK